LSHSVSPVLYFQVRSWKLFVQGWLQNKILLISASWVAKITGVSFGAQLNVILVCISLMARDVDHSFMCFLAICTSSFEKFQFICPFLHWIIDSLGVYSFWAPGKFWLLIPCQMYLAKIFSHSVGCLFCLMTVSFAAVQKLFS
jgi:hypothetical protein